jgi:hypothetical protein
MPILKTYPRSGSFIVDTLYDKFRAFHCTHPAGWRSLKNRDSKLCSWVPWDSDLRKAALSMPGKNWKLQTRLLVREGAPHQQTRNCLKIKRQGEKICRGSQMGAWHQDGLADWLSVVMWLWLWLDSLYFCGCSSKLKNVQIRNCYRFRNKLDYVTESLLPADTTLTIEVWVTATEIVWTTPTERLPLVGEVSANFCG